MKRTIPMPIAAEANTKQKNSKRVRNAIPNATRGVVSGEVLEDGRLLGPPAVDSVPKRKRNVIPQTMTQPTGKVRKKRDPRNDPNWKSPNSTLHRMCRTLMPLALEPDSDVELGGKQTRIRGLNQNRLNVLIAAFKDGMTILGACKLAGISDTTYRDWMRKGEEGIPPYNVFYHTITQTHAEFENRLLRAIFAAGTEREEYEEVTEKEEIDPTTHKLVTVERKRSRKYKHPRFEAALALLERRFSEWRIDRADQTNESNGNTGEQDLLAMDAVTTGGVDSINKETGDDDN